MEIFDSYAEEFLAKYKRLNRFITHAPSIGNYRENILGNFLISLLPNRYSIKTGFVYDSNNNLITNQIDILLIDENIPHAYFFKDKDLVVVHSDAVICGVEVKSILNYNNFTDCCQKAKNFKMICKNSIFLNFAFQAKSRNFEELLKKWFLSIKDIDDIFESYAKCFYVLNKGQLLLVADSCADPWGYYFLSSDDKYKKEQYLLASFFSSIVMTCQMREGLPVDPYNQYQVGSANLRTDITYRYNNVIYNNVDPFKDDVIED